jgi:hypothetical protein
VPELGRHLLEQRNEDVIDEYRAILGVIGDEDDLPGRAGC